MDVSVVVPTRNRSALLSMTLRSVLAQRDVALEVIVVDEASTDDTGAVLASVDDKRLRLLRHAAPQGLPSARNRGAGDARGDWLAFIDDDDLWAPDKLARQLHAAAEVGREWAYAGAVNILGSRIVHGLPPLPPDQAVKALPRQNAIPGGGSNVIIRRSLWLRAGPFDTRFRAGGEDWEMSIRLAKLGSPAWVCSPLVARRLHSSNMSLNIAEAIRAGLLIETLHETKIDWGTMHRWLAHSCLRAGRRGAAMGQFARAAVRGQLRPVVSDLVPMLRQRFRGRVPEHDRAPGSIDAWRAAAAAWLGEFGVQ